MLRLCDEGIWIDYNKYETQIDSELDDVKSKLWMLRKCMATVDLEVDVMVDFRLNSKVIDTPSIAKNQTWLEILNLTLRWTMSC